MRAPSLRAWWGALLVVAHARLASAAPPVPPGPSLEDVAVEDRSGGRVPLDLAFVDQRGETVALRRLVEGGKPVVVVLAYYTCPLLCTVVLNGLTAAMKGIPFTAGREFNVASVSIDPR